MDKKLSLTAIGSAVAMAVIILLAQKFTNTTVDTIEAGQDAATIAQISAVLDKKMVVDINGETMTYGQTLSRIATNQAVMQSQIAALIED